MEIDLDEFLSEDADRSKPHKYLLHGLVYNFYISIYKLIQKCEFIIYFLLYKYSVLVHSGDVHGGHYFALLKPEKDGKWFVILYYII